MQRSSATCTPRIDVGAVPKQRAHDGFMTPASRGMQSSDTSQSYSSYCGLSINCGSATLLRSRNYDHRSESTSDFLSQNAAIAADTVKGLNLNFKVLGVGDGLTYPLT